MMEDISAEFEEKRKSRCRLRDLGIQLGVYPTGQHNAITDVEGVRVGHTTVIRGRGKRKPSQGPVRTGVTVILPSERIFDQKLVANGFILNGAGEVAGLTQLSEWGLIETPIALTNTMAVGRVSDAVNKWMSKKYSRIWDERNVIIPVVGECDDSFLNDSVGHHVKREDVVAALENAQTGPVAEGAVGSGTGMICCDFKAGIGTSSRIIRIGDKDYTIGVLVMSNFGVMEELRVDGLPVGRLLAKTQGAYRRRVDNYGSIIAVVATDLPLGPMQLGRLCKRSALGIGRVGSHAAHGSGEIIVGFSTANWINHGGTPPEYQLDIIRDEFVGPAYRGVIEATEEAILNSLTASVSMDGVDGHDVPAIDIERLKKYYQGFKDFEQSFI